MKMKVIFPPHPWGASDGTAMVVYNYKQFDAAIPKYSASPPPLNGVLYLIQAKCSLQETSPITELTVWGMSEEAF